MKAFVFAGVFAALSPFVQAAGFDSKACDLTILGIWSHGELNASAANPSPRARHFYSDLYTVTTLGNGFGQRTTHAEFSPDSNWIAGQFENGKVAFWDLKNRREVLPKLPFPAKNLRLSPDSKQVLIHYNNRPGMTGWHVTKAQVFDLKTGAPLSEILPLDGGHRGARYTDDSRFLLVSEENGLHVFDTEKFEDSGILVEKPDPVLVPSGDYVLGLNRDGSARVTNLVTGESKRVHIAKNHDFPGNYGDISISQKLAVLEGKRGEAPVLRDIDTLKPTGPMLDPTGLPRVPELRTTPSFSPDGRIVYATYYGEKENIGVFWDTETGEQVRRVNGLLHPRDPKYSKSRNLVAIGPRVISITGSFDRTFSHAIAKFFGDNVVLEEREKSADAKMNIHRFTHLLAGQTAELDDAGYDLNFAPDGSRFYYGDHGGVHLLEIHPHALEAKKALDRWQEAEAKSAKVDFGN